MRGEDAIGQVHVSTRARSNSGMSSDRVHSNKSSSGTLTPLISRKGFRIDAGRAGVGCISSGGCEGILSDARR